MERGIFSKPLKIIDPHYSSSLTDLILELEHLRRKTISGSTPAPTFLELKEIFHLLESIASARIEGNHTTIAEAVEQSIHPTKKSEEIKEIDNIENTLEFVDTKINGLTIDAPFVTDLHKKLVKSLTLPPEGEGDKTPGEYRNGPIKIAKSKLIPPANKDQISGMMNELFKFINAGTPPKYDLIKTALAHHRFAAIHPFNNGNGRCVRTITYAMLIKQGFSVSHAGRLLNPTAVFCNDRETYYKMLARADRGDDRGLLAWCEYVIRGLKSEIEKTDRLTQYDYVLDKLLTPAIKLAEERQNITSEEANILHLAADKKEVKAADIRGLFPSFTSVKTSRVIKRMRDLHLLKPVAPGKVRYTVAFRRGYLLKGVMEQLDKEGFVPSKLNE